MTTRKMQSGFQRLDAEVMSLKEQVKALEKRLKALETAKKPRKGADDAQASDEA